MDPLHAFGIGGLDPCLYSERSSSKLHAWSCVKGAAPWFWCERYPYDSGVKWVSLWFWGERNISMILGWKEYLYDSGMKGISLCFWGERNILLYFLFLRERSSSQFLVWMDYLHVFHIHYTHLYIDSHLSMSQRDERLHLVEWNDKIDQVL